METALEEETVPFTQNGIANGELYFWYRGYICF